MDWLNFREPVNAWTHLLWMVLAIPGTVLLWRRSRGNRPKQVSLLVFGLSLIYCFLGSALYHSVQLPEGQRGAFACMDYIGIYVLIAGSCTPIAFNLLHGRWRWGILGSVWLLAIAGIVLRLVPVRVPTLLSTSLYLGMGWGLASCLPELARALPLRDLRLIPLGGLLYTLGAMAYLFNWPVLWPGVFGGHELFHLFVMGGSLAHFIFVLKYVAPSEWAGEPELTGELVTEQGRG
jgi:hemolysin III